MQLDTNAVGAKMIIFPPDRAENGRTINLLRIQRIPHRAPPRDPQPGRVPSARPVNDGIPAFCTRSADNEKARRRASGFRMVSCRSEFYSPKFFTCEVAPPPATGRPRRPRMPPTVGRGLRPRRPRMPTSRIRPTRTAWETQREGKGDAYIKRKYILNP